MRENQLKEFARKNRDLFLGDAAAPDIEQFLEKCRAEKKVAQLYAEQKRERRAKRVRIISVAASIVAVVALTLMAFPETRAIADRVGAVILHMFTGKTEGVAKAKIVLLLPETDLIESSEDNNTQTSYSKYQYKDGTEIEMLQEEADAVSRLLSDQYTDIKYGNVLGSRLEYVPDVDGYIGQFRYREHLITITVHSNSKDFFFYVVDSIRAE